MKRREKKPVEYRDTFDFRVFPVYSYTNSQNRRLTLFQGRVEHWRKAINYANSFQDENKISLLYMIGYHSSMKAYVDKMDANIVVLCAKVSAEMLKAYDAYWDIVRRLRGIGQADKEGNLLPIYYEDRKIREKYPEHFQEQRMEDEIIDRYEHVKAEIIDCFSTYTLIDKRGPERPFSHDDLNSLILQYFPHGRERCAVGEKAYTSPKRVADALQAGLDRENAAKLLDLPPGTDTYEVCRKNIKRCQMNLNTTLRNVGYIDLDDLFAEMKKPPYGWDAEPHAAYCFGYAVSGWLDKAWVWDGVACFPFREAARRSLRDVVLGVLRKRRPYVLISDAGNRLSKRFAYMFGVVADELVPSDDTDKKILALYRTGLTERKIADELGTMSNVAVHKRIEKMRRWNEDIPFCNMAFKVCSKIADNTRWPISILDDQLRETLYGYDDLRGREYSLHSVPVFGIDRVREKLSYFTWERCRVLKDLYEKINTYVPTLIRERYGSDVDLDALKKFCTTQASSWLWKADTFWECVERFISNGG